MDNDSFNALKIRGAQILGLKKLAVKAIEAEGIRLNEAASEKPFATNLISWEDAAKVIRQKIWGQESNGFHVLHLESFLNSGLFNAALTLAGKVGKEEGFALLKLGIQERTLLSLPGEVSDFVQVTRPTPKGVEPTQPVKRRVGGGTVNEVGELVSGEAFTASKIGTGAYKLLFSSEFAVAPVITITPITNTAIPVFALGKVTTKEAEVRIWNFGGGTAMNCAFTVDIYGG